MLAAVARLPVVFDHLPVIASELESDVASKRE